MVGVFSFFVKGSIKKEIYISFCRRAFSAFLEGVTSKIFTGGKQADHTSLIIKGTLQTIDGATDYRWGYAAPPQTPSSAQLLLSL